MSVAVWSGSGLAWDRELTALKCRPAPVFRRSDVIASAGAFIDGLLSGISRKTGWLMAEQAGLDCLPPPAVDQARADVRNVQGPS